jgi:hypothetical protein
MGPGKGTVWSDPESRFSLELPVGWQAQPHRNTIVEIWKNHPDYGTTAKLTIEMRNLPPKVKLVHLSERVMAEVRGAARNVQIQGEDRITVSGQPAIRRWFTHQEQGHAELTDEVVQVIFMIGERAFIMHLETAAGARQIFAEDFDKMLKTFVGSGPGEEIPIAGKRKKLKAGEMVNPDGVPY